VNFEKWVEIGEMAKTINQAIVKEMVESEYNKTSKEMRWLRSANKAMTKMRDKLDNLVFEQYPDKPTQELCNIFYGSMRARVDGKPTVKKVHVGAVEYGR